MRQNQFKIKAKEKQRRVRRTGAFRELSGASQVVRVVRNPPANAGDAEDVGRSPGAGKWCHTPVLCLEHPMDRGAWRATVNGSMKSQTQLSAEHTHTIRAEGMQTSEVLSAFPVILSHCKQTMDLFTGSQSKH